MADPIAQNGLSKDASFLGRLAGLMAQIAKEKITSDPTDAYAKKVLNDPFSAAQRAALYVLQTDNYVNRTITVSYIGSGTAGTIANSDAEASGNIRDVWATLTSLFG